MNPFMNLFMNSILIGISIFMTTFCLAQQLPTPISKTLKVDPQTLAVKATACFGCHGETGHSPNSIWPNLAGQKEEYLIKQLSSFRQGTRKDPMMNPVAETLSDQQIQEVACYFSSLK